MWISKNEYDMLKSDCHYYTGESDKHRQQNYDLTLPDGTYQMSISTPIHTTVVVKNK